MLDKNIVLKGKFVKLVPLSNKYFSNIVQIRNQRSNYFLDTNNKITVEDQKEWYKKYLLRKDDIFFVILNNEDIVIGMIRLYNITLESCYQGSFAIDENHSFGPPYALETLLLTAKYAFNELKVKTIIHDDRADNKNINSISKKLGGKFVFDKIINGVKVNYYHISNNVYLFEKYNKLIIDFYNKFKNV